MLALKTLPNLKLTYFGEILNKIYVCLIYSNNLFMMLSVMILFIGDCDGDDANLL